MVSGRAAAKRNIVIEGDLREVVRRRRVGTARNHAAVALRHD